MVTSCLYNKNDVLQTRQSTYRPVNTRGACWESPQQRSHPARNKTHHTQTNHLLPVAKYVKPEVLDKLQQSCCQTSSPQRRNICGTGFRKSIIVDPLVTMPSSDVGKMVLRSNSYCYVCSNSILFILCLILIWSFYSREYGICVPQGYFL